MKILVSTASRHGSTLEVGIAIAAVLRELGHEVDTPAPEAVHDVAGYDAIVLGSAVYAGRWLAPARDLVERETATLLARPVWLFSSGPIGEPAKPAEEPPEGLALKDRIKARDHQVFAGKLDRAGLSFAEKAIVTMVGAHAGDYRPWNAVVDWARRIGAALAEPAATTVAAGRP